MSLSEQHVRQGHDEQFSLVSISVGETSVSSLRRVARRICRNVRRSDCVLYAGNVCAVVFSGTSLLGGQAATRRLRELLVDVEYELQVLSGAAALTMLQHLRAHSAVVVQRDEDLPIPIRRDREQEQEDEEERQAVEDRDTMPHLAVLSQYPTPRILNLFPYELACHYSCVPVGAEGTMLTLATCQRLELDVVTSFQEITRRNIFLVRCEASMIRDILLYWQRISPARPHAASI